MSLIPHPFEDDGNGECAHRLVQGGGTYVFTCRRSADLHEDFDLPRGERRRLDRERAEAENRSVEPNREP